jgi:ADP-heptose:LPS heptosyltransferase
MGDLVITLPYLQALKNSLSDSVRIDLLTREEVDSIPKNIHLFNNVYSLGGGRNFKKIMISTLLHLPRLVWQRYDVVLDLQNNIYSEIVRKAVRPAAWTVFDRFSPLPAGERTRLTIEAAGLGKIEMSNHFRLKNENTGLNILKNNGWNGTDQLVVLNPAGFVETRNWKIENYVQFANLWLDHFPGTKFLVLGIARIEEKAVIFKNALGDRLINLVNKTTPPEAFAVLQHISFVLSEDSGLMHMAWVSGIPTIALFGSTKSVGPKPLGPHSFSLDSSDLPCGNCMQSVCQFGDVHCLTRHTPEMVFNHAIDLLKK